jgi:hypothetical protein
MAFRFRQQMVPTIITRVIIGRQIRRSLVGCAGRGRCRETKADRWRA